MAVIDRSRRYRFFIRLGVLVGFILFSPVVESAGLGRTALAIGFLTLILVRSTPREKSRR